MKHNGTTFEFAAGKPSGDVLIVPLLSEPSPPMTLLRHVDQLCEDAVSEVVAAKALAPDGNGLVHTTRSSGFRRILVVNLGKAAELTGQKVRTLAAQTARWLMGAKVAKATLRIDGLIATPLEHALGPWASGMTLGGWNFAAYLTKNSAPPAKTRVVVAASDPDQVRRVVPDMRDAQVVAAAANYARELAHEPANVINPRALAEIARKFAVKHKLRCTIIDAKKAAQMNMGGLLGVGQGAQHPPCLIQLEYRPLAKSRSTTALVGKAITFDTGGYSIKPSSGMETMKFDKCGGMTVMGVLKACADLRLPCNVVGVIAAAENMVSAQAYRPGDILRMANGKTVEVTNTDAEGRLVLADALWYAQEHLKPTRIIDYATLTGGVIVALGSACAGLMCTDDALADALEEAGRNTHERVWRLPLWDDYFDLMKSPDADMKNSSAKRHAHAIQGGIFLKQFVNEKTAWAHLDIAGTATDEDGSPVTGKGATGFGVRLTIEYLRRYVC